VSEPDSSTVWQYQQTYTHVAWTGSSSDSVHIELWQNGSKKGDYSSWIPNTGTYTREEALDSTWSHAQNYQIRVVDQNSNYGLSDNFLISEPEETIDVSEPDSSTVWQYQQTYTHVAWTGSSSDSVHIELWQNGSKKGDYSNWVPNTGTYTRDEALDPTWSNGQNYQIRVVDQQNNYGLSECFQISDGTLPSITGLEVDWTSSLGNTIVLTWDPLTGYPFDGYEVYFSTSGVGTWTVIGITPTNNYTDLASSAGYYSVRAYEGSNYSENYATPVSTMPNIISTQFSIYDNYAPASYHSGIIFGFSQGTTGLAPDPSFIQDLYCYDPSKGDDDICFYSGSYGPFGNGNPTRFYAAEGVYGYCPLYGSGSWWEYGQLYPSDDVIFGVLYDGYYVKIYIDDIFPEPLSQYGTGVTIHYEIQTHHDITVFTTNS